MVTCGTYGDQDKLCPWGPSSIIQLSWGCHWRPSPCLRGSLRDWPHTGEDCSCGELSNVFCCFDGVWWQRCWTCFYQSERRVDCFQPTFLTCITCPFRCCLKLPLGRWLVMNYYHQARFFTEDRILVRPNLQNQTTAKRSSTHAVGETQVGHSPC